MSAPNPREPGAEAGLQPRIRTALESDLDDIMQLEAAAFGPSAWTRSAMEAEIASPFGRYIVAAAGGVTLGYAGLRAIGADGDVQTIAVAAQARGRGLGRALLRELLAEARRRGVAQVFLDVREDNAAAIALYNSEGFEQIGRRMRYYQPEDVDALSLRVVLDGAGGALRASSTRAATAGKPPVVLGIETSCDETGVGIVRGRELMANRIASSMDLHARFGGVVPEIAARAHLEALEPTITRALDDAGLTVGDLDAVAVTAGPGLAGALMVGIGAAKGLATAANLPLYGVNHLVGHVAADTLSAGPPTLPTIALLVSGGHTSLLLVRDFVDDVVTLGETIDDAAGEAFDKTARLLGLAYPGGPSIDAAAVGGNPEAIHFPRGLTAPKDQPRHRYNFSFSGLKTAVARHVERAESDGVPVRTADVAASFREAVVDVLLTKALDACESHGVARLLLGGGVVANRRLREVASERCAAAGVELRIPPLELCTDNGAMIAAVGAMLAERGVSPSEAAFGAESTLDAGLIQVSPMSAA